MKSNKISKSIAKGMVSVLNKQLHSDANSASSIITYQPKVPKEISKFKRYK